MALGASELEVRLAGRWSSAECAALYAQLTAERMQGIYERMGGAGAISSQECAQAHIPFWF